MGLPFVLIFWGVIAGVAAVVVGSVVWLASSQVSTRQRALRVAFAAFLPFGMLAWSVPAVILFAVWSHLTGLDYHPVFGDAWSVSLPNEYTLEFIDVDTTAGVHEPGSPAPVVHRASTIASRGDVVYGLAGHEGFVLDTASRRLTTGEPGPLFSRLGLDASKLTPVAHYPPSRGWNLFDFAVLALLLLGVPSSAAILVWTRTLKQERAG